jgi:undecaprenyl pyrophosphate phosphatase UppP
VEAWEEIFLYRRKKRNHLIDECTSCRKEIQNKDEKSILIKKKKNKRTGINYSKILKVIITKAPKVLIGMLTKNSIRPPLLFFFVYSVAVYYPLSFACTSAPC